MIQSIEDLKALAEKTGVYYQSLLDAKIYPDLAVDLVRSWHTAQLETNASYAIPINSSSEKLIADRLKGLEAVANLRKSFEAPLQVIADEPSDEPVNEAEETDKRLKDLRPITIAFENGSELKRYATPEVRAKITEEFGCFTSVCTYEMFEDSIGFHDVSFSLDDVFYIA